MLGRLQLYTSKNELDALSRKYPVGDKTSDQVTFSDEYSEPLFEMLGAKEIDSLDYSAYENASIIHDLNTPVPEHLHNRFTCVVDGGTLEHVFNFPVAIKSCMEMLKPGGHFIGISPVNNQMGHGFYQFSPELYYRVFSPENGFRILKMFIALDIENETHWYEVADPKTVNNRVMLVNNWPLSIRFIAEKVSSEEVFRQTPQQSDYTNTWNAFTSVIENKSEAGGSRIKFFYRKFVPHRLKVVLRNIYNLYKVEQKETPHLGKINPEHFRKVEL
jgi:SAM-dependent methyltransferase